MPPTLRRAAPSQRGPDRPLGDDGAVVVAQPLLVELPRRSLGQLLRVQEDVLGGGNLEVGQRLGGVRHKNLGRGLAAHCPHRGADDLAKARVGKAEDGALAHARVVGDGGLDLRAVDVLAAADDEVLHAVEDVHEAALELADVAGVEEAVGVDRLRRLLRQSVVALHNHSALDAHLPTLSVRHGLARLRVDNGDSDEQRQRPAAALGVPQVVNALVDGA
mmetsp:Transcript_41686/g.129731  ORF Transcript_41686/g.129731 Transcript_41686/m.129731 type:complete len:219 (-) Transcript_41686:31-687(-)